MLLEAGQELTITTDYSIKGNKDLISMSYAKLAQVRRAAPTPQGKRSALVLVCACVRAVGWS